jgi:hypothetical protein
VVSESCITNPTAKLTFVRNPFSDAPVYDRRRKKAPNEANCQNGTYVPIDGAALAHFPAGVRRS